MEFKNLRMTRLHRLQQRRELRGLCCDDRKLYCVEFLDKDRSFWLTMYDISGAEDGSIRQLEPVDSVEVRGVVKHCRPRVDSAHRVFVPCEDANVRIFRCEGGRLVSARDPLTCVEKPRSLAVNTSDSIYVCDYENDTVCLVSVSTDTVIRPIGKPEHLECSGDDRPWYVSVLGETVLVCYGRNTLVTYRNDSSIPCRVLQTPEGLGWVCSITTDGHSSFIVMDWMTGSVYVLDRTGTPCHRIPPGTDSGIKDCAVVRSQLWLGYYRGYISVMSSV